MNAESLLVAMHVIGPVLAAHRVIAVVYLETERLGETSGLVCLT